MGNKSENVNNSVAKRIKELRLEKGTTARAVAEKLDNANNPTTIYNYESGARNLDLATLSQYADIFGTTADFILGRTNVRNSSPDSHNYTPANAPILKNSEVISEEIGFFHKLLERKNLNAKDILLVTVQDDAMSPELMLGDDVLLSLSDTNISKAAMYCLEDSEGDLWFRFIRKEIGGKYKLYTADKQNPDEQTLTKDEFNELKIIGRVIWRSRWQ
ncbi:XRE family transcriptional regulator [Pseudoalteromonas sp. MMG024]|uniref:XRE family transcriptional regulator n=1 Tax=Pseudoalteromonas sp. MMG024 TaxID=2909980 RepID=UPI001F2768DD|nr:XRE family transcriptional regulator [Pseudoalteromonas sp. MMG024]MCF6459070.1 helix-turn-helix domain-containing protein [Pseudoalteromonas sp. MMG024]